jgi:hypothetical protein
MEQGYQVAIEIILPVIAHLLEDEKPEVTFLPSSPPLVEVIHRFDKLLAQHWSPIQQY